MVLHTDQQHPHMHMVVKAEGEDGQRGTSSEVVGSAQVGQVDFTIHGAER
jgi:hypothetical protein